MQAGLAFTPSMATMLPKGHPMLSPSLLPQDVHPAAPKGCWLREHHLFLPASQRSSHTTALRGAGEHLWGGLGWVCTHTGPSASCSLPWISFYTHAHTRVQTHPRPPSAWLPTTQSPPKNHAGTTDLHKIP